MKSTTLTKANNIELQDFIATALVAVGQAATARPNLKDILSGPVTLGIVWNPDPDKDPRPGDPPPTDKSPYDPTLTELVIRSVSVNEPLYTKTLQAVLSNVQRNELAAPVFADALRRNFAQTMGRVFDLTEDDQETAQRIERESQEQLELLAQLLTATSGEGGETEFALAKKESEENGKKKIDWKLSLKAKCQSGDKKNCSVEGGIEITF
ncbi:MAG: hypothetical protein GY803_02330 [Chloroflexi bacterium]|nr:hypothetical protein [Chloroflexota bacterium]